MGLSDQTCQNQAVQASKMKIESEMGTLSSDLDEMAAEAGLSEEKAQRAMLTPPDWLMSSVESRTLLRVLRGSASFWTLRSRTCSPVSMRPRPRPSRVARRP